MVEPQADSLSSINDIRCPVCIERDGIIVLSNCGHNLCYECMTAIININNGNVSNCSCPTCRRKIVSKPVIMFALVNNQNTTAISGQINIWWPQNIQHNTSLSTFATNANQVNLLQAQMNNYNFQGQSTDYYHSTYSSNIQPYVTSQNIINCPSLYDLCLAAKEEYLHLAFIDESMDRPWRIANNLLPSTYTSNQIFGLTPSNTVHQLQNDWSFSPFTEGPFIIKYDSANIICRNQIINEFHRRILIKGDSNIDLTIIMIIENEIKRLYPTKEFISELKIRGNDGLTLASHMGTCEIPRENLNISSSRIHQVLNLTIASRGVWFRNNTIGVRWHVVYIE